MTLFWDRTRHWHARPAEIKPEHHYAHSAEDVAQGEPEGADREEGSKHSKQEDRKPGDDLCESHALSDNGPRASVPSSRAHPSRATARRCSARHVAMAMGSAPVPTLVRGNHEAAGSQARSPGLSARR